MTETHRCPGCLEPIEPADSTCGKLRCLTAQANWSELSAMSYSVKEAARTIVLSASNHPPDIAIIGCLVAAASIATHVGATRERLMSTLEAAFVLMQHEQHRRSS